MSGVNEKAKHYVENELGVDARICEAIGYDKLALFEKLDEHFIQTFLAGHASCEEMYHLGHKGACWTCEPVAEENQKIQSLVLELAEALEFYKDAWGVPYSYADEALAKHREHIAKLKSEANVSTGLKEAK